MQLSQKEKFVCIFTFESGFRHMTKELMKKSLSKKRDLHSELAFEQVYDLYAPDLLSFIHSLTKNKEVSEDILQEILLDFWKRRETIEIQTELRAYLFSSAKYAVLNYIRSEKVRKKYLEHFKLFLAQGGAESASDRVELQDLISIVMQTLEHLPNRCAEVFYRSRFQHRSIQEIADELNISTRTVENYISRAMAEIKRVLDNYAWWLILFTTYLDP